MDAVLVDVPCTGTGTWRRRPDAKWRLTGARARRAHRRPGGLLDQAVRYVKPGGRLVYITCSLLPDENGDQVAAFLARHEDFALVPPAEVIASSTLSEPAKEAFQATVGEFGVLMTPHRTNTDGFFVAVVRKG